MPFIWSIGTIVGPSIGGMLASPHDSWPGAFPAGGLFDRYPYLLPNLMCSGLLLVSIVLGFFLLEETHPDMQTEDVPVVEYRPTEETPLILSTNNRMVTEVQAETYGAIENPSDISSEDWDALCIENEKDEAATPTKAWNPRVVGFIVALSIFTYHSMTFDHLLPIFFEETRAEAAEMLKGASFFPLYSPGGRGMTLRAMLAWCLQLMVVLLCSSKSSSSLGPFRNLELTASSSSSLSSTQSSTF